MSKIKLTDELLEKATKKSFENWIDETAQREKEFSPSENFEKKMNHFLENRNKFSYKISRFKPRRSIVVIAAIFLLMLSSLSVGAIRDEVSEVFKSTVITQPKKPVKKKPKKKKEKPASNGIYYQNTTSKPTTTKPQKTISVEYELDIDDLGYTRITENVSAQKIFISYQSYDQSIIINFTQSVNEFEKPQGEGEYQTINEQQYYVCRSPEDLRLRIYWQIDEYYFKLSGNISKETAFSYIALLKERNPQEETTTNPEQTTTSPFEYNYCLNLVDYGYEEYSYTVNEYTTSTVYTSAEGDILNFYQENITSIEGRVDETLYTKTVENVDGIEFTIYQLTENNAETVIFWQQNGYQFSIFADGEKEQLIQYAKTCIAR